MRADRAAQNRVAIGRGFGNVIRANIAARAGAVFNDDGGTERRAQFLRNDPRSVNARYDKYFGYVALVSSVYCFICTLAGWNPSRIATSTSRFVLDAVNRVWGRAISGATLITDISMYINAE